MITRSTTIKTALYTTATTLILLLVVKKRNHLTGSYSCRVNTAVAQVDLVEISVAPKPPRQEYPYYA